MVHTFLDAAADFDVAGQAEKKSDSTLLPTAASPSDSHAATYHTTHCRRARSVVRQLALLAVTFLCFTLSLHAVAPSPLTDAVASPFAAAGDWFSHSLDFARLHLSLHRCGHHGSQQSRTAWRQAGQMMRGLQSTAGLIASAKAKDASAMGTPDEIAKLLEGQFLSVPSPESASEAHKGYTDR